MDREVWVRYYPDDVLKYDDPPSVYECEPGVFMECDHWVQLEWSESLQVWFGSLHDLYFTVPADAPYNWKDAYQKEWRSNRLGDCSMYATNIGDIPVSEPVGVSLMDLLEEE